MAFLSRRRRIVSAAVVLGVAIVVGILFGGVAAAAVVIVAIMALMVVYMRSHTDVLISGDTDKAAEEWSRKQFGSNEDRSN